MANAALWAAREGVCTVGKRRTVTPWSSLSPSGSSFSQVKWLTAQVVSTSTSQPRPARPIAASRDTDSDPPTTDAPKRGGTKARRLGTLGLAFVEEPCQRLDQELARPCQRELLSPDPTGVDQPGSQRAVRQGPVDRARHQQRVLLREQDPGPGHRVGDGRGCI